MQPFTVQLALKEEKKHSVRYDATAKEAHITAVYISKKALPTPFPQYLDITVSKRS